MESEHHAEKTHVESKDLVGTKPAMPLIIRTDSYRDDHRIKLGWRSWMVVFVTCFAIMAQVFVVRLASSFVEFF